MTDDLRSLIKRAIGRELAKIPVPANLRQEVVGSAATERQKGAKHTGTWLLATFAVLVIAVAVGVISAALRPHPGSKPAESPVATTTPDPNGPIPDATAGSALGYYEPGGYPILINQQVTDRSGPTTWKWDGVRWVKLVSGSGSPYAHSNLAYDGRSRMTVVISGPDTLGWNGSAWVKLAPSPPISGAAYLAFDQAHNRLILLDSYSGPPPGAATWSFDGHSWTQIKVSTGPAMHFGSAFAYDPRSKNVVLFGGVSSGAFSGYQDTWIFNGDDWIEQQVSTASPSGPASMAADGGTNRLILITKGGSTWTWTGSRWIPLVDLTRQRQQHLDSYDTTPAVGPYAGLVYSGRVHQLFLWSGTDLYENGSRTWAYFAGDWHFLSGSPLQSPTPTISASAPISRPGFRIYVSSRWGYVLEYPDTWYVVPNSGAPDTYMYFASENVAGPIQMTPSGVWLTVGINQVPDYDCKNGPLRGQKIVQQSPVTIGGLAGTRTVGDTTGGYEAYWSIIYSVSRPGTCYSFQFGTNVQKTRDLNIPTADAIISTVRFVQGS
jgi:hypothetical protein